MVTMITESTETPMSRLDFMHASGMLAALTSPSAQFATADFDPTLKDWSFVELLVVGAGGIGCELLHLLAISGFAHITIIDMDTVELSNLNRQFFFTRNDIGKPKSHVAAAAVEERCPGISVTPIFGRLEDQPGDFYRCFDAVLLALDSISSRRWINRKIAEIATRKIVASAASISARKHANVVESVRHIGDSVIDQATPIIDAGTEGFEGHCRVVYMQGNKTPCIECEMYLYNDGAKRTAVPLCTLESVPRAPEHCVLYVQMKEWPEHHQGSIKGEGGEAEEEQLDPDNAEHVRWVTERARSRQAAFGIGGSVIDDLFTLGVIKNVVPAVGFTNAFVAGQAVTELLKWLTGMAPELDNCSFYNGATEAGIYAHVQSCCAAPSMGSADFAGRCLVCAPRPVVSVIADAVTPDEFCDALVTLVVTDPVLHLQLRSGMFSLIIPSASGPAEILLRTAHATTAAFTISSQSQNCVAGDRAGVGHRRCLADLLTEEGHSAFVREWKDGTLTATVECVGASVEARLCALVEWQKAGCEEECRS